MEKKLDYKFVFDTIITNTVKYINDNKLKSIVLGISGGIDSTVVAAIAHEVSKQCGVKFIGRSLPIKNKVDEFDTSKIVGEAFCDDFKVCNLEEIYNDMRNTIEGFETSSEQTPIANGNIQARLRMIYLYNLASLHKGIVLSTDNQTEYQLGFWTIHGDVGDFNPLFGLWKHEVYELAKYISHYYFTKRLEECNNEDKDKYAKMYRCIDMSIDLIPTDGLGISNSDLEQIGGNSYDDVDEILKPLYDSMINDTIIDLGEINYLQEKFGVDIVNGIWSRHFNSNFKRKHLPIVIERSIYEK